VYKKLFYASHSPCSVALPIDAARASIVQDSRTRRAVCGIDQPPKSGEAFRRSLSPNRHRNRWSGLNRLSRYRRHCPLCAIYVPEASRRDLAYA